MSFLEVRINCDRSPRGGEGERCMSSCGGDEGGYCVLKGRSSFGRKVARMVFDPRVAGREYEEEGNHRTAGRVSYQV